MDESDLDTFAPFPKLSRLFREIIITEKIDGTNAQVVVSDDGTQVRAASRKRWIEPSDDNFGFAKWVEENKEELAALGPGRHFGEWWGAGIQRRYNLEERRFSLFNVSRWGDKRPACCHVVPVLYQGLFSEHSIHSALYNLGSEGSAAAPGFMNPEGIVVFHAPSQHLYKYTIGGDGHKGA
jgi:hypothetical protein